MENECRKIRERLVKNSYGKLYGRKKSEVFSFLAVFYYDFFWRQGFIIYYTAGKKKFGVLFIFSN